MHTLNASFQICTAQEPPRSRTAHVFNFVFGGVIPKCPRSHQRAEGSGVDRLSCTQDPSLRLKNGYSRDDFLRQELMRRGGAISRVLCEKWEPPHAAARIAAAEPFPSTAIATTPATRYATTCVIM